MRKADQADVRPFAALARAAKQRMGERNAQYLGNTAWVNQAGVLLFAALASAAKQRMGKLDVQALANWALAFA